MRKRRPFSGTFTWLGTRRRSSAPKAPVLDRAGSPSASIRQYATLSHRRCPPPEGGTMGTRRLSLGCTFVQWSQLPVHRRVPGGARARSASPTIKDEEWVIEPATQTRAYRDLYGNRCRRLMLPAGRSEITYRATAEVPDATEEVDLDAPEIPPHELPDDVLIYTLPSRFCLPDVLANEAWSRFGGGDAGIRPGAGDLRLRQPAPDLPVRQQRRRGARPPTCTSPGTACAATSPTWPCRSAGR